jgi:hypothetical protein
MTKKVKHEYHDENGKKLPPIISQVQAATLLNMSRQNFNSMITSKIYKFVVEIDGIKRINIASEQWHKFYNAYYDPDRIGAKNNKDNGTESKTKISNDTIEKKILASVKSAMSKSKGCNIGTKKKSMPSIDMEKLKEENPDVARAIELTAKAEIAKRETIISHAAITKEKAIQEEIKTLELKRELAPVSLIEFFFSFAENMIQRIYRRPVEIEADLESLFIGGKKSIATQKLIRELEAIVIDVQKELIEQIKKEGFRVGGKE